MTSPKWKYCTLSTSGEDVTLSHYSSAGSMPVDWARVIGQPRSWGQMLAELGEEGWELVSVVHWGPSTQEWHFKRPA